MPRGYWLPIIAAVGLILVVDVHSHAIGQTKSANKGHQQGQKVPSEQPIPTAALTSIQGDIKRIADTLDAESRKQSPDEKNNRAERNVVAQETVARWTRPLFIMGGIELFLTLAGIILVGFTVHYTRKTWHAQKIATDAAVHQAQIANATFKNLERPYLYVSGIQGPFFDADDDVYVTYKVANHGKIAAKIESVLVQNCAEANAFPTLILQESLNGRLLSDRIFGPGEVREKVSIFAPSGMQFRLENADTEHEWVKPHIGTSQEYFVYVRIDYGGPFTSGHCTKACWRWDNGENAFVELNDSKYNSVS